QRRRERGARHQRALDRRDVAAGGSSGIEQDLQKVRRAAVADRTVGLDQLELLLGIAGPGGDDGAAECPRRGVEDETAGCEMIAEGVEHDITRAEADRKQGAGAAPGVVLAALGLEDRTG